MSLHPPLFTVPAFATRLVATIQNLALPITGAFTVLIEKWLFPVGLGHLQNIIFKVTSPPDSGVVTPTIELPQMISVIVLAAVDFGSMIDFPAWTDTVFSLTGLVLLVLGMMAWLGSHNGSRRAWGRRMAFSGGGLFVVGTAFGTFVDLLEYVLG